ncbi:hypothetical protein D3C85_1430340 [compost metagenome]
MSALALSFSASNLAISWAELMSVSMCLRPYLLARSSQVPFQLAQASGMPTLLTLPSLRAASSRALRSVSAAMAVVHRAMAEPSSDAMNNFFIRSSLGGCL